MPKVGYVIPTFRESKAEISNYLKTIQENYNFEVEIVLVNDNPNRSISSKDFEYLSPNLLITIVNNRNQVGPGESRNIGIELIKSDWIGFLDDDDQLLPRNIGDLERDLDLNVDIICLQFEDSKGTFSNLPILEKFQSKAKIESNFYCKVLEEFGKLPTHCQHYLFNKNFLKQNSIKFLKLGIVEDISFVAEAIYKSSYISFNLLPYYYYNSKGGTSKETVGVDKLLDIYIAINHLSSLLHLPSTPGRVEYINFLKRVKSFLESFFISRLLSVHEISRYIDGVDQKISVDFSNYLRKVKEKVDTSLRSYFDDCEIIVLYCYCPMALGLIDYLRSKYIEKHFVLIDDSLDSSLISENYNLMHPDTFIDNLKRNQIMGSYKSIDVIICHLHESTQNKITSAFAPKIKNVALASAKIKLMAFDKLFKIAL